MANHLVLHQNFICVLLCKFSVGILMIIFSQVWLSLASISLTIPHLAWSMLFPYYLNSSSQPVIRLIH
ncbi:hypothetical protein BY996DRAFT_7745983 [Phakopsora pachyrhizi]|nr:hypothetical protein BY996DRAFT_7832505 [Phakopsora pachyrhizi]KAI8447079.1 hypothetical protein BY996DRAFT_7745983 [Phakopsora pachyrhizi]